MDVTATTTATTTSRYALRKREKSSPEQVQRHSRVKKSVCGSIKVKSRRMRLKTRSSTIKEEEFIIPGSHDNASPAKVVIKTNPLFSTSAPVSELGHHSNSGQEEAECVFYGQRRKIRKTKEQEMINAIMDITMYGEDRHTPKNSLVQKVSNTLRNFGRKRKGATQFNSSHGGAGIRSPLSAKNTTTTKDMYNLLTQV